MTLLTSENILSYCNSIFYKFGISDYLASFIIIFYENYKQKKLTQQNFEKSVVLIWILLNWLTSALLLTCKVRTGLDRVARNCVIIVMKSWLDWPELTKKIVTCFMHVIVRPCCVPVELYCTDKLTISSWCSLPHYSCDVELLYTIDILHHNYVTILKCSLWHTVCNKS